MSASRAAMAPDFSSVTELPQQRATRVQMSMLRTRYGWAAEHAWGKDVLEAACGAGLGLGWLAERAMSLEASDIDEENCRIARETYRGQTKIHVNRGDALDLPFEACSFDLVVLFEALYYLADVPRFLAEARRVLRPGGALLISTVNCEWSGFHPSPFHTRYWTGAELYGALEQAGFATHLSAGFPERDADRRGLRSLLKIIASRCGCMPRTMQGKALLKRIFYGRLDHIPSQLEPTGGAGEHMIAVDATTDVTGYRNLYFEARRVA